MSVLRASLLALFFAACGRAPVVAGAACSPLVCRAPTFDGGCVWTEPICCDGAGTPPACGWSPDDGSELSLQDGGVGDCVHVSSAQCL